MKLEMPKDTNDQLLLLALAGIALLLTISPDIPWKLVALGLTVGAAAGFVQRWITRPNKG